MISPFQSRTPDATPANESVEISESSTEKIPPYLQHNDWEKELNYKLWVTKGARFVASARCRRQDYWSKLSLNFLNSYLIILGLLPFFLKATSQTVSWEMIGIAVTGISIIALVWGMHETAEQFELKAHKFHECTLAIGRAYNRLRQAKQLSDTEKQVVFSQITAEYEEILAGHDNHEPLDFAVFKLQKPEYFGMSWLDIKMVRLKALIFTRLLYAAIVLIPFLAIVWLFGTELKAAKDHIRQGNKPSVQEPATTSPGTN
jgi:hypothetical protein